MGFVKEQPMMMCFTEKMRTIQGGPVAPPY